MVTDNGEKVLPGSQRPDGTIRKERRIRAGYTPQDEQPVYQSVGVMARRDVPKCPGLDPEQASAAGSGGAKSKSAKKNEKRKAKKTEDKVGGAATGSSSSSSHPQPSSSRPAAAAAPPAAAAQQAAAAAADVDPGAATLDRQIKALSKKVRQCQALLARQTAGEALSAQEAEKVSKMPGWQDEIKELEHQLAKLGV